jgi:SP family general alpha glucoside:H+ symporter-like MFS transporter
MKSEPTAQVRQDITDTNQLRLLQQAQDADAADHALTLGQALHRYKVAVFWAAFLSLTLWMEGFDLVLISSLYGQTQFKERFGTYDSAAGGKVISPAWQTGISNAALCGQIIGLAANGFVQDWIGCRKTMMLFLVWMIGAVFAIAFAPSLAVLAFGEALCGYVLLSSNKIVAEE